VNLKPIVTIGITTYDREELLTESINSVLNQEFTNWKLIISNDNPKRFLTLGGLGVADDSRIAVINQSINLGEIANLNWLMNSARTEYFTWLADDDLMHPQFLQILLKEINDLSSAHAIFTDFAFGQQPVPNFYEKCIEPIAETIEQKEFLLRYSSRALHLVGLYGIFRLKQLQRIGGIPKLGTGFSPGSDNLLPILLSEESNILYINSKLIFFRIHSGSISNSSIDLISYQTAENDFIQLVKRVTLVLPDSVRTEILITFINWFSDNHLTVIYRQPNLGIIGKLYRFLKIEVSSLIYLKGYKNSNRLALFFIFNSFFKFLMRFVHEIFLIKSRKKLSKISI